MSKYRKLRILNNLTQDELAKRLGTSQSHLSRIESGEREPNDQILKKYQEIFSLSFKFID